MGLRRTNRLRRIPQLKTDVTEEQYGLYWVLLLFFMSFPFRLLLVSL